MKSVPKMWKVGVVLTSLLGIFLAACGPTTGFPLGSQQACVPTAPDANEYRGNMHKQVKDLYSRWAQAQRNTDNVTIQSIKNNAFTLLVDRVKRWTDSVDIPADNTNVIRFTLTYISPELAQIIILNHQLYKNVLLEAEFEQMLQIKMNEIADREELIFLMTVTYSQYNYQIATQNSIITLNIPMDELSLSNAGNLRVIANHVNPPLRQEIVISRGPFAGYIAFPIGVGTPENCVQVIERRWNNVLNISTDGIKINGNDYIPQLSWSIDYHPLVDMDEGTISPSVSYAAPLGLPTNHEPPVPIRNIPIEQVDPIYWQQMAIHVWGYVTGP